MSTTIATRVPEQRTAGAEADLHAEKLQQLPAELRVLADEATTHGVTELDNLNIDFNQRKLDTWNNTYNSVYYAEYKKAEAEGIKLAGDRRSAATERKIRDAAAKQADIIARHQADVNAYDQTYAALDSRFDEVTLKFMPVVNFDTMTQAEQEAYAEQYYKIRASVVNAANMDPNVWTGEQNDDGSLVGNGAMHTLYEMAAERPLDVTLEQTTAEEASAETESTPEQRLELARKAKQEASVELQRLPFRKRKQRKEAEAKYQVALRAYAQEFNQYHRLLGDELKSQGVEVVDIYEQIVAATNEYVRGDIAAEKKLLIEKGGWLARLGEEYANLSKGKKIAYGIGVSAILAATGGILGLVGGGALATVGAMGAARVARSYAMGMSKLYSADEPKIDAFIASGDAKFEDHEVQDLAAAYIVEHSDASVEESKKIRRRAVGLAMASVAIPGLGSAASYADSVAGFVFGPAGEWADNAIGASDVETVGHAGKAVGEAANVAAPKVGWGEIKDLLPDTPAAEKLMNSPHFYENGKFNIPIRPGDGFIRLGERYGLTDAQMEKMMEIAAKQKGETYRVGNDVRLNLGDRKLSFTPTEMKAILSAK